MTKEELPLESMYHKLQVVQKLLDANEKREINRIQESYSFLRHNLQGISEKMLKAQSLMKVEKKKEVTS